MQPLYVGECRVCFAGRLIVMKMASGLFIRCEECLSEWEGIEDAGSPSTSVWGQFKDTGFAEPEDLVDHPWRSSIVNQADL